MTISAIVAVTENNAIGREGGIPWSLPADLAYMRDLTMGHPLIMGRKTHDSIGRTLPGRLNVVISRNPDYKAAEGSVLVGSLEEALNLPEVKKAGEVFIFGGEAIYKQAMPLTDKIYLTRVHTTTAADRFFHYDEDRWQEVSRQEHKADDKNQFDYDFIVLERKH